MALAHNFFSRPYFRFRTSPRTHRQSAAVSGSPPAETGGLAGPGWQVTADPRLTVTVTPAAGVVTVVLAGELDLVSRPVLAEQLELIGRDKPARIVFDLAGTLFADLGSTRLLVCGGSAAAGQPPVLRRPGPGVRRILQLTGLDAYCEIEG
jgi:anti-anti-sigma factor